MSSPSRDFPRRGEVYWVDFGVPQGSEQGWRRPAVVVSNDVSNEHSTVVIVAAATTRMPRRHYPWNVFLPAGVAGSNKDGTIFCNQLRTLDRGRLERLMGMLDDQRLRELDAALAISVGLGDIANPS